MHRRNTGRLFYLFTAAFIVRVFYALAFAWRSDDSEVYFNIARNLLADEGFAVTFDGVVVPTTARPPLYPVLIALTNESETALLLIQAALSSLTVVLVYLIAWDFDKKLALATALLFLIFPMANLYAAALLTETLFVFLVTATCFFWGKEKWVLAGITLGVAFLTRSTAIVLILSLLLLVPKQKQLLIVVGVSLLIPSIWIVRNSMLEGKLTMTQSSGYGINLLFGTYDTSKGPPDVWSQAVKEMEVYRGREMDEALNRISANPFKWIMVRLRQYPRLFFDSGDYLLGADNRIFMDALRDGDWLIVGVKLVFVGWYLLFYIAVLIGIFKYRWSANIILFPLVLAISHLPMWIESRYFLPAVPLLCVPAAAGLRAIVDRTFSTNS